MKLYNYKVLPVLLLLSAAAAFGQPRVSVKVAAESLVEGDAVLLGQVARVSPVSERIAGISLGYAPGIGMTRELTRMQIVMALKASGVEESQFLLDTPPRMVVRRASQMIEPDKIREAIETAINRHFTASRIAAEIVRIDAAEAVIAPVGPVEIRASMVGVRNYSERFPVPVEIRVDGKVSRSFAVTAEVAAFADVLVANCDLAVNKMIEVKDFRLEKVRLEKNPTMYVRDPAALRGVQVIRPLESGRPIMLDAIVPATVIKLGDPVRIEAYAGRVKIVVNGEARANGRIGERILVKNKDSGAMLQGIVVDRGLVKIF